MSVVSQDTGDISTDHRPRTGSQPQPITTSCSPADYANTVRRFSVLETGIGSRHERLGRFLSTTTYPRFQPHSGLLNDVGSFLTLYEFETKSVDDDSSQIVNAHSTHDQRWDLATPHTFGSVSEHAAFELKAQSSSPGSILFLRGWASPEWMSSIGSAYLVDPEYFSRWLDFPYATKRLNQLRFLSPALPSSAWNLIELPMVTIGERAGAKPFRTQDDLDNARTQSYRAIQDYHDKLHKNDHGAVASSVVRDICVFDHSLFAIEQKITICMQPSEGQKGWVVLVWTDAGDDFGTGILDRVYNSTSYDRITPIQYSLYPIARYRPNTGLSPEKLELSETVRTPTGKVPPCASRLHLKYGLSLRRNLMAEDPYYALSEVFTLAATSQKQFLNMIEYTLGQYAQHSAQDSKEDFDALPNLRYLKSILLRQSQQIQEVLHSIRNTNHPSWPKVTSNTEPVERARSVVEKDYDNLYEHSQALGSRCQEAITVLMTSITIQDAREGIAQTQRVAKLTFLAFIFVPLSFTTSFFGMNFNELEELSIWKWVAVSVPIVAVTLLVLFVDASRYREAVSQFIRPRHR